MNSKKDLNQAVDNLILEYRRYSMTLKCLLSIKYLCENDYFNINFEGCEVPFKYKNKIEKSPQPDFICQEENKFGIYGEIKSSITTNSLGIKKELSDLKRLENEFIGWKTENGEIRDFAIWLLIFNESVKPFLEEFKKEKFGKKILISSWDRIFSLKKASDIFVIRKKHGSLGIENLDEKFSNTNEIEEDKILEDFEEIKFFKQKPPIIYLLEFLWMDVFTSYSEGGDFEVTPRGLYDTIKQFYPIWANIPGEQEQVRLRWINEALEILFKVNLAEKKEKEKFKVLFHKNPGRNFKRDLARKICGKIPEIKQKNIIQQKTL